MNRSEGWKYAKTSGHQNELNLEKLLREDRATQLQLLNALNKTNISISEVSFGGLNEGNVEGVLGKSTKSKTDGYVKLSDNTYCNISLKKSPRGQVYMISEQSFILGYETQYKEKIPNEVKRGLQLFIGTHPDIETIIEENKTTKNSKIYVYEKRKRRVVGETLYNYNPTLYHSLLKWIDDSILNITDFCFSKGLAKHETDWAHLVWYKNTLKKNSIDEIFTIDKICNNQLSPSSYGNRTGGTTIQIPWGHLQWHQGNMQFHHKYKLISNLFHNQ